MTLRAERMKLARAIDREFINRRKKLERYYMRTYYGLFFLWVVLIIPCWIYPSGVSRYMLDGKYMMAAIFGCIYMALSFLYVSIMQNQLKAIRKMRDETAKAVKEARRSIRALEGTISKIEELSSSLSRSK